MRISVPRPSQTAAPSIGSLAPPQSSTMFAQSAPAAVQQVLRSAGEPLDSATRTDMELRFGSNFSRVRIHADPKAATSANEIAARSFAAGNHLIFAAGEYSPASPAGRALLSHELAHVVQQRRPEYQAASAGNCEQDAEDAAASISRGHAPVVRAGAVLGTIQRAPATQPISGQKAQKHSPLVRIERYWHSPVARAFFKDGSNEEVTFVESRKLDPATQPEATFEKVVSLNVDRSSLIRPHVEFTSHSSGSKVKVVTRLSPEDRISKLPGRVRGELSERFLSDTDNGSDPETMELVADLGDGLKERSSSNQIEMTGRDPATASRMQAVDQWVGEQQKDLDNLSGVRRAGFTQMLSDIRQVGVTGPVEAEDLDVQDIELVLAGAAGGQSGFKTFAEFKQGLARSQRFGNAPVPEEATSNPDFFARNEYRKAWKAEAAGLRKMDRIAKAAQAAPFVALGASAAAGVIGAGLAEVAVPWFIRQAAVRGVSTRLLGKYVGSSLLAYSGLSHLTSARDEAKAAGMDPNSPSGVLNTVSAATLRTLGVGEVVENLENKSLLTHQDLKRSVSERIVGSIRGVLDAYAAGEVFAPEIPGGVPGAVRPSGPTAAKVTAPPEEVPSSDVPGGAPQADAAGTGGQAPPSAQPASPVRVVPDPPGMVRTPTTPPKAKLSSIAPDGSPGPPRGARRPPATPNPPAPSGPGAANHNIDPQPLRATGTTGRPAPDPVMPARKVIAGNDAARPGAGSHNQPTSAIAGDPPGGAGRSTPPKVGTVEPTKAPGVDSTKSPAQAPPAKPGITAHADETGTVVNEVKHPDTIETTRPPAPGSTAAPKGRLPTFQSIDPLVGHTANAVNKAIPGIVKSLNEPIANAAANLSSDADITLSTGDVIEVKSGGGKKATTQVGKQTRITAGSGETIVYGPKLGPSVIKGIRASGVKVFTDLHDLIGYLKSKGGP